VNKGVVFIALLLFFVVEMFEKFSYHICVEYAKVSVVLH